MKTMKKTVAILLCVTTLFLLCACGATQEDADALADRLFSGEYVSSSDDDYRRVRSSSLFADALANKLGDMSVPFADCCMVMPELERLGYENAAVSAAFDARVSAEAQVLAQDDSDFAAFCALLQTLDEEGYELPEIRDAFQKRVKSEQENVFADANTEMVPFLKAVVGEKDYKYGILPYEYYYGSLDTLLPYGAMKKAIEEQCAPVIHRDGEGGYYDDKKDEFEEEHYYYSPLTHDTSNYWSAGYQTVSVEYRFEGDFMKEDVWYVFSGTQLSDEANTLRGTVYYKGESILYDGQLATGDLATGLLNDIHDGDVYTPGGTDIFVIHPDCIQMVSDGCFKCVSNK